MRNALLIAAILLASHRPTPPKDVSIETIQAIFRSVVPVVCGYMDSDNKFQLVAVAGSGFFVDRNGRFVTAGHVLDDWQKISATRRSCNPAIYIPHRDWGQAEVKKEIESFTFMACSRDTDIDVAVCNPIDNPFESSRINRESIAPVTFDTEVKPVGTPVAFTGFPLESVLPITSKGFIGGYNHLGAGDVTTVEYVLDKAAWPGASGSLVYLENGKVIGIILKAGINEGSGLAFAGRAAAIVDFLSKHPATPKPEQKSVVN